MKENFFRLARVGEPDMDEIVKCAGGSRVDTGPSSGKQADYRLGDAVLELKVIQDDPLAKPERQERLALLMRKYCAEAKVMIVDPGILPTSVARSEYYRIMSGPIKNAIGRAAAQLDQTCERLGLTSGRVLIVVNNGFSALDHAEFSKVVLGRVRNDTHSIDHVIIGGLYYYSDGFDNWVIAPFDLCSLNVARSFVGFAELERAWDAYAERCATDIIMGRHIEHDNRAPVGDQVFDYDGITFVKPAKKVGRPSEFWPHGRPRNNSTGLESCPPVGMVLPMVGKSAWQALVEMCPEDTALQGTYVAFREWTALQVQERSTALKPVVAVDIDIEDYLIWLRDREARVGFGSACAYALECFDRRVRSIIAGARYLGDTRVQLSAYVLLRTVEIGQDKANDLASIAIVSHRFGTIHETCIVDRERIIFEHALALAASYAMARSMDVVRYVRDKTFAWE